MKISIYLLYLRKKIDNSFPENQFTIEGYDPPYRLDRNQDGGGLLVYFRTGIPNRKIKTNLPENVEGLFFDMKIRKNVAHLKKNSLTLLYVKLGNP